MIQFLWLIPIGFLAGTFGTLIGSGGGFILLPILLILYPKESPAIITSISLAVVFFNAFSGSISYARMRRIDYKSGLLFAVSTIPGAILGALTTSYIPRNAFEIILGLVLISGALYLFWHPLASEGSHSGSRHGLLHRSVTEADGTVHNYAYNPVIGMGVSLVVGYLSSVLGIGGGIIHVPVLTYVLNFPVHVSTATSHFVLAVMALAGTAVHIANGTLQHSVWQVAMLSAGVVCGAQVGAWFSSRVSGVLIMRSLSLALGFAGGWILWSAI